MQWPAGTSMSGPFAHERPSRRPAGRGRLCMYEAPEVGGERLVNKRLCRPFEAGGSLFFWDEKERKE